MPERRTESEEETIFRLRSRYAAWPAAVIHIDRTGLQKTTDEKAPLLQAGLSSCRVVLKARFLPRPARLG
jgi:hypothetical protein